MLGKNVGAKERRVRGEKVEQKLMKNNLLEKMKNNN